MRKFLTLALAGLCAFPIYHTYQLNSQVSHLREDPGAVSFFAYHRYGFAPQSVVFNVTTDTCSSAVNAVVPTFLEFVRALQSLDVTEIRLAWQGSTIAVLELPVRPFNERQVFWDSEYSGVALSRAVRCTSDGNMEVDWLKIQTDGSIII